ncbi:MAG: hypothetical protein ABI435_02045 [Pseudolysinimonas sp.]
MPGLENFAPRAAMPKLATAGVTSLASLLALNERELLLIPGVGPGTVGAIASLLAGAGYGLAVDPYAAYVCARHSEAARDVELRSYFLCELCRNDFEHLAFSDRKPEWISTERVSGFCGNCNENLDLRLAQWLLCGTCDRVVRSIGRGLASAKFVKSTWASVFEHRLDLILTEADPIILQPRGRRSDPNRVATADFIASQASGEIVLGLELKSGRSALPGGGIGNAMGQFQLDTTDCDDITAAAVALAAPVFLIHAQVIGRAHAPTERYEGVGLWFARPWDLLPNLEAVRRRPRETRDAAYFKTVAFRPFSEFPAYLEGDFARDLKSMHLEGFPTLYSRP